MPNLPATLRFLISLAVLFIVFTQAQADTLADKILLVVLTIFCTEWLFYFIPFLKRKAK